MNTITSKFKEVLFSVLPIVALVFLLNFTIAPMENSLLIRFVIGSVFVILGLTVFLLGVDIGITPLGKLTGLALAKTNNIWMVMLAGLVLGFFISIAEPGLMVLANQVNLVTAGNVPSWTLLIAVSIGLAVMLSIGFFRIFYNIPLFKLLGILYTIILFMSIVTSREFLAISFDASGSTTGILAVPLILSLSVGISNIKKDSKASEKDSFGLVAIASTGAIMSVLVLDIISPTKEFAAELNSEISSTTSIVEAFVSIMPQYLYESFMAIMPLLVILLVMQVISFHLKKKELRKLLTGFIFAFLGLFVFLLGVNAGFMEVGTNLGQSMALLENKMYIIFFGFVLGVVTILAEPAVYVLTSQIEEVTVGYVKKKAVLVSLALGVGLAVSMSVIRVLVKDIQLWHYLLPGYLVAVSLMFVVPKLFVGIAFDAGGVATGPMTATFILAFIQGAANAFEDADLMADGFGMIAMVAMMPIITLEILGMIFKIKSKRNGGDAEDE